MGASVSVRFSKRVALLRAIGRNAGIRLPPENRARAPARRATRELRRTLGAATRAEREALITAAILSTGWSTTGVGWVQDDPRVGANEAFAGVASAWPVGASLDCFTTRVDWLMRY